MHGARLKHFASSLCSMTQELTGQLAHQGSELPVREPLEGLKHDCGAPRLAQDGVGSRVAARGSLLCCCGISQLL